jgi:hypothetical protein
VGEALGKSIIGRSWGLWLGELSIIRKVGSEVRFGWSGGKTIERKDVGIGVEIVSINGQHCGLLVCNSPKLLYSKFHRKTLILYILRPNHFPRCTHLPQTLARTPY